MKEKEMERVLKALANKRRLTIISILQKDGEKSVGDIAEILKISFKATSKHLLLLTNVDILEKEQRSSQAFYTLNQNPPNLTKKILRVLFME